MFVFLGAIFFASEYTYVNVLLVLMKGVVVLGIAWYLMIWCINKGGPHFVSVFQPLQTVMVAIMAAIFLGDTLYIGG